MKAELQRVPYQEKAYNCYTRVLYRVKFFSGLILFRIFVNDLNERIRVDFAGTEITLKNRIRSTNYLDKVGKSPRKYKKQLKVKIAMLLKLKEIVQYSGRSINLNKCKIEQDVGLNKAKWGKMM